MKHWNWAVKGLANLFLESGCPLCQRSTPQTFCRDCQHRLKQCQWSDPLLFWQPPLPIMAWGNYGGTLKQAIATLKYGNQPQIARLLGHWTGEAWLQAGVVNHPELLVVPIPMHGEKRQQRGYDQAVLFAQHFCEATGLPFQKAGLERIRATQAQFGLSIEERAHNLSGAFQVNPALQKHGQKRSVLLIDDIYTTGATVNAAIEALRHHHIQVYGVVAIAKAQRSVGSKPAKN